MSGVLSASEVGVVAIGRNEGERLRACLSALTQQVERVVYVDSDSTDDSVAIAEQLGVKVVHLDTEVGFTAGKARNLGAQQLLSGTTPPRFIQFVDGDCILEPSWLPAAIESLDATPSLAVVAGRRRELYPERTIFNRQCDMEWNTPIGPANAVGGDALYRTQAFQAVSGFDPAFICGEEPELCFRLRKAGWLVERLDCDMTRHDAAMTRWSQWWRRVIRTGWAFAEGAATYGASEEHYNRRESLRIILWGVAYPAVLLVLCVGTAFAPSMLWLLLLWLCATPLMVWRIARYRRACFGDPWRHGMLYGALVMLGKIPEAVGAWRYWRQRRRGGVARIIEYK